jgi:hypothetical protein
MESMNDFKLFLPHDIAQVKKFLEDSKNVEQTKCPKKSIMLAEKEHL